MSNHDPNYYQAIGESNLHQTKNTPIPDNSLLKCLSHNIDLEKLEENLYIQKLKQKKKNKRGKSVLINNQNENINIIKKNIK